MNTTARRAVAALSTALTLIAAAGCSAQIPAESTPTAPAAVESEPAASTPEPDAPTGLPTVAGYAEGEFPPVPLFQLPDLSLLDASVSSFTIEVRDDFATIPGVTVSAAQCDAGGSVIAGNGSAYLYGDGSGNYTGADGSIQNYGDGSGSFTLNGVKVDNYGDGSGTYDDGTVSIQNYGDGSGVYSDASMSVNIYGDGSGIYTAGAVVINNYGDGSGNYADGTVSIENYGDGSGVYSDADITINNYGDGTGTIDGVPIEVEPIAIVPVLGVFPPLSALQPIESCGTILTFQDGVLFDFDRSEVRADAAGTLKTVAAVLTEYDVPQAIVSGHTDAIGSDDDNQTLSEERAASVVAALEKAGVTSALTAEGYGETSPVAANEIDGEDNAAGRQLNRRVEIFIPAAL
ncbi:OmpA family protein [Microbacterium sp. A93]|uniref:OmpA family protein n=1 Tax=Microbacterium sp. A93 TaxID=3450716 RepID=UPI003F4283B2